MSKKIRIKAIYVVMVVLIIISAFPLNLARVDVVAADSVSDSDSEHDPALLLLHNALEISSDPDIIAIQLNHHTQSMTTTTTTTTSAPSVA